MNIDLDTLSDALSTFPKHWDGRTSILTMKDDNYPHWRQMEWIGFYFQYLCDNILASIGMKTPGNKYGRTDFDGFWKIDWDFKSHPIHNKDGKESTTLIANDLEATTKTIEQFGCTGLIVACGEASFDNPDTMPFRELDKEKEQFKDEKEQLKFETDYQMALNETHMNIIKGQFDTIREQQEAEKELLKTAKENLAKGQKKLLKDKIELSAKKKEQEKREADFQIKEDAQDAQKKALDAEAEEQKSLIADGRKYRQMRGQRTTTTAYENQQQEESKIAERRRGYTPWDE